MGSKARAAAIRTHGRRGRGSGAGCLSRWLLTLPPSSPNEGEVAGRVCAPARAGASRLVAAARASANGASARATSSGVWNRRAGSLAIIRSTTRGELRRHVGADLAERPRRLLAVGHQLLDQVAVGERRLAGQEEVERAAEAVDVGPDVGGVRVVDLLGGDVVGRAQDHALGGHARRGSRPRWRTGPGRSRGS